jgi:PHD/YefM family antitoxin component YafN of YafNO toxin-antitoxin module
MSKQEAVMTALLKVSATEFARNFAKYQDEAISAKVISVTSHGRIVGAYLSASELEHYEMLKRREREVLTVGELDDDALRAVAHAEYGRVGGDVE